MQDQLDSRDYLVIPSPNNPENMLYQTFNRFEEYLDTQYPQQTEEDRLRRTDLVNFCDLARFFFTRHSVLAMIDNCDYLRLEELVRRVFGDEVSIIEIPRNDEINNTLAKLRTEIGELLDLRADVPPLKSVEDFQLQVNNLLSQIPKDSVLGEIMKKLVAGFDVLIGSEWRDDLLSKDLLGKLEPLFESLGAKIEVKPKPVQADEQVQENG